jgi:plastocyanin
VDPEQIYQEVLQEEQQKGSSGPVAEGRAKAARVRAEHGSPHPKEPKWWPGAQPHLEGGEAPAEVAEEPAEVAEEPAAEPAAEQAPAEEAPPVEAPAEQPAAQPAAAEPAQAAVATAQAPAYTPTTGVSPGSPTGTRLRPEDAVTNEAQFTGQQAMYERRRLIDEVIKTGVPAAAAAERERSGSGALAILYLLIPILVIGFVIANRESGGETTGTTETANAGGETGGEPGGGGNTIVASGIAFDVDEIMGQAGEEVTGTLVNEDSVIHNIAFFNSEEETSDPGNAFYTSEDAQGGSEVEFNFTAPDEPGDYPFVCDYHPGTMTGTLVVEGGSGDGGGGG